MIYALFPLHVASEPKELAFWETRCSAASKPTHADGMQSGMIPKVSSAPPRPTREMIVEAVRSLYADELKPVDRVLRKRVLERSQAGSYHRRYDMSLSELQHLCHECPELVVEASAVGPPGEWAVMLRGSPGHFVDASSSHDEYGEAMWQQLAVYLGGLAPSATLPGGRLAAAEQLVKEDLPFLAGRSLGSVCHIVQLAISRRSLRYSKARLVPCDRRVAKDAPDANVKLPATRQHRAATWPEVAGGLQSLFQTSPRADGQVPLSNVKRLFRSKLDLEIEEATLGCDKLSDVFRCLAGEGYCELQATVRGLVMVPLSLPFSAIGGGPEIAPFKHGVPNIFGWAAATEPGEPHSSGLDARSAEPEPQSATSAWGRIEVRKTFIHMEHETEDEDLDVRLPGKLRANSFP